MYVCPTISTLPTRVHWMQSILDAPICGGLNCLRRETPESHLSPGMRSETRMKWTELPASKCQCLARRGWLRQMRIKWRIALNHQVSVLFQACSDKLRHVSVSLTPAAGECGEEARACVARLQVTRCGIYMGALRVANVFSSCLASNRPPFAKPVTIMLLNEDKHFLDSERICEQPPMRWTPVLQAARRFQAAASRQIAVFGSLSTSETVAHIHLSLTACCYRIDSSMCITAFPPRVTHAMVCFTRQCTILGGCSLATLYWNKFQFTTVLSYFTWINEKRRSIPCGRHV